MHFTRLWPVTVSDTNDDAKFCRHLLSVSTRVFFFVDNQEESWLQNENDRFLVLFLFK